MQIVRIMPKELPENLIFRLNWLYKAELGEFIAITDEKEEVLYVNQEVPKKDIDGFLEVIIFPDYWVNDDEYGMGQFLDYVYEKYGSHTYNALTDAHSRRMKQEAERRAKETAKAVIPLIEREINSEAPVVEYDENLLHEIFCAGRDRKGRTPENICSFSSVYLFYLGYLMGTGKAGGGAV